MKTSMIASFLALAASTPVLAQYTNQSAPFQLILVSENKTIDGTALSACHAGAAIEALCVGSKAGYGVPVPSSSTTFTFNTSTSTGSTVNETIGETGYVTWELRGGNFNLSSPLGLTYNPSSNVALPLLEPGYGNTLMAFDSEGLLNIQSYIDDRLPPPYTGEQTAYYRWFVCKTYYTGYQYTTLAWTLGDGEPQNPTCSKVDVKRVFN
ncbi:hypothetical protein PVAG01_10272 [Phlyctema vagabunda]|uniref:DUF7907 domain-containing protein n=1 Tax=Phlyctema vagabunda TaxID=108571 RepID=A0ABR4P5K2_9HELO